MNRFRTSVRNAASFGMAYLMTTVAARANDVGGFANTMTALQGFITGTPTKIISMVAIVVAGLALIFGEDLGVFAKRLLMVVIAVAMILGASSIAGSFFTTSGALVP